MNLYANLQQFKEDAAAGSLGNANNDLILRQLQSVSRRIDQEQNRMRDGYYVSEDTRYYPSHGAGFVNKEDPTVLYLDEIASITSVKIDDDGDGVFETTLTENTDYWLEPGHGAMRDMLKVNPNSSKLSRWPWAYRTIEVIGLFGYEKATEAVTTLAAELNTSATSATVAEGAFIYPGDTLWIGDEQLYVTGVAGDTLTITRAVNGTTAATHSNGASVLRHVWPPALVQATVMLTARLFKRRESAYANVLLNSAEVGTIQTFRSIDPEAALFFTRTYKAVA